jgi:hypothetical protein
MFGSKESRGGEGFYLQIYDWFKRGGEEFYNQFTFLSL